MKELMPDSKMCKAELYALAWGVLLGHPGHENASADDKAHAKCWLTHRAVDGEISFEDWRSKIAPVEPLRTSDLHCARWGSSQGAAEVWLWSLHRDRDFAVGMADGIWDHAREIAETWPPAVLNLLRLNVVRMAYAIGKRDMPLAIKIREDSLELWLEIIGSFDPDAHLWRFAEARDDLMALQCMTLLGMRAGILPEKRVDWCNLQTMRRDYGRQGWLRAVREMMRPKPSMQDREILAASLFSGVGVELGVARGAFSAEILGNDRVERLWSIDRWNDRRHRVDEYRETMARLEKFGLRSRVLRMEFAEAVWGFADASLDFVYVDGYAHTGQDNGKTLRDWWCKLKPGGIFAGHDYAVQWPLTQNAVDDFCEEHGLTLNLTGDDPASWWVVKN